MENRTSLNAELKADSHSSFLRASRKPLCARVVSCSDLNRTQIAGMYRLYSANYLDTSTTLFERDLATKTHVVLLMDEESELCGFSTLEAYSSVVDQHTGDAVYIEAR